MNDVVRRMLRDYLKAVKNFHPIQAKAILKQIEKYVECSETTTSGSSTQ